jgi:uncharacterized membrane protein HdeD (DUF308 family)
MNTALGRNWRWVAARGVLAIVFGLYALFAPGLALGTLVMLFGAMVFVGGILTIVAGARRKASHQPAVPIIVEGIVCVAFGLLALLKPGPTAVGSLFAVSAFAIVSGVVHIVAGIKLRHEFPDEWMLILSGILTTVFGVLMVLLPWAGLLSLIWLIGAYSLFFGLLVLFLGFRLRALAHARPAPRPPRR